MPTLASNHFDVRNVPADGRKAAILGHLDSLEPGESSVLLVDSDPRQILAACREVRPGAFDWALLQEGPPSWRAEIRRRRGEDARRGVRDFLQWDHERLDLIFLEANRLAGAREHAATRERLGEFRTRLLRHIRMEEELLFPAFVAATGGDGPVNQMLSEHIEIKSLLEQMAEALSSDDAADGFAGISKRFMTVLGHHNAKEERIVYPMTDQRLPPSEREALVLAMQGI